MESHQLSPLMQRGWQRILSAIATSEGCEQRVLAPVLEAYRGTAFEEGLERHSSDEQRHHEQLSVYLCDYLNYSKDAPTLADTVFYDFGLSKLATYFKKQPQHGLVLLLFYEVFSTELYTSLQRAARHAGLVELAKLLHEILRDERRHIAALNNLLRSEISQQPKLPQRLADKAFSVMLQGFAWDLSFAPAALHNRSIRESLFIIGVDPDTLEIWRRKALQRSMRWLRPQEQRPMTVVPTDRKVHHAAGEKAYGVKRDLHPL